LGTAFPTSLTAGATMGILTMVGFVVYKRWCLREDSEQVIFDRAFNQVYKKYFPDNGCLMANAVRTRVASDSGTPKAFFYHDKFSHQSERERSSNFRTRFSSINTPSKRVPAILVTVAVDDTFRRDWASLFLSKFSSQSYTWEGMECSFEVAEVLYPPFIQNPKYPVLFLYWITTSRHSLPLPNPLSVVGVTDIVAVVVSEPGDEEKEKSLSGYEPSHYIDCGWSMIHGVNVVLQFKFWPISPNVNGTYFLCKDVSSVYKYISACHKDSTLEPPLIDINESSE